MIDTFRTFLLDESANATTEYAMVATVFAFLVIGLMTLITGEASGQVNNIDTGLNNRNGIVNS